MSGSDSSPKSADRTLFSIGAFSAFLAVAAGAFGAHGLRGRLTPEMLSVFETGARYQMYHALALLAAGWASARWPGARPAAAGWFFGVGTVLFSGSLYALALTGVRSLGAVTPAGGICLLVGWACLGSAAWR